MAAEVSVELERFDDAETGFERALALDPTLTPLTVRRGLALVRLGRTAEARRHLAAFADAGPKRRAAAEYFLGLAACAEGETTEARRHFDKSLALAPDDAACAVRLAQLDLADGHFDDARRRADDVLTRAPLHTAAAHLKARALAAAGMTEAADAAATRHRAILAANDRIGTLAASLAGNVDPDAVMIDIARVYADFSDAGGVRRWTGWVLARRPDHPEALALRAARAADSRPASRPLP